ncbi:MAG TPA: DNA-binding response regulator [Marinobacter adhaerens]|uniref:DNA-binding response regulator n=1 Tax=Marinobacter adhaerens TaxID=1033846 RepID=A0A352IQI8_9GAMM|nr:DNA-binding response regulator [Marinobacter adhaerens]
MLPNFTKEARRLNNEFAIHIVDDEPNILRSMRRVLGGAGYHTHLHHSASEFLDKYDGSPACLILDLKMPGMGGEQLVSHILQENMNLMVLVVTGHASIRSTVFLTKAGVVDVIEKPFDNPSLLEAVHKMTQNARRIFAKRALTDDFTARMSSLSKREKDVFNLLLSNLSSTEIAKQLGLSKKTVDIHRSRVMGKMGTASVAELIWNWTTLIKTD